MENNSKKGFLVVSFCKLVAVFFILTLVGCGTSGGGDGGDGDVTIGTMVLTSELGSDEILAKWATTTITAKALDVDDGTEVTFTATGGRINNAKMNNGEATTTFYAIDSGGQINITATTTDSLGNSLQDTITVKVEEDPYAITLKSDLPLGTELTQGGQTTITATVYGSDGIVVTDGTEVRFTATSGVVSSSVATVSGIATAIFNAASSGGIVTITATAAEVSAEATIKVASGPATYIALVSVTPDIIGLRGTGVNEVATLVYNVKDGGGNPVSDGQEVMFSLRSPAGGGEFLSTNLAITVGGEVSVSLTSGTIAGVATVTASSSNGASTVSTETRVTMGYGRPDQRHLSIAFEKLNIPGLIEFGIENGITAYIADRYSNPIPAGNPVYFASACGTMALTDIDGVSTNLTNAFGQATATSITGKPIEPNGLCRMLIWTEGEEAWVDSNANGFYDDGEPHQGVGEPYIDSNNNGLYDIATETYFDLDGNGVYTPVDNIWDADTFVWVDDAIRWSANTAASTITPQDFTLSFGQSQALDFTVADINGNPLPAGTKVLVKGNSSDGVLTGETDFTIPDSVYPGPGTTDFSVSLTSDYAGTATDVDFTVTVSIDAVINGSTSSSVTGQLLATPEDLTPSAKADSVTATAGSPSITAYVMSNDVLGDLPTSVTSAYEEGLGTPITVGRAFTAASGNRLSLSSSGVANYTPTNVGVDKINYTITDANGDMSSAVLTITVAAPAP